MRIRLLAVALLFVFAWGCQPKEQQEAKKEEAKKAEAKKEEAKPVDKKVEDKKVEDKVDDKKVEAKVDDKKVEAKVDDKKVEAKVDDKKVEAKVDDKKVEAKVEDKKEIVGEPNPGGAKINLTMHVMSQCPFGTQVMNGASPVVKKMGEWVDLRLEFIGNMDGDTLTSMHGEAEVNGDIIELCLQKHLAENYKFFAVLDCMNVNMRAIPGNWEECAMKAGFEADMPKLKECYAGQEGKDLLRASFEASQKAGARGSPTMFMAGKPYRGGRGEADFMRALCAEMPEGAKAKACAEIPPPITFDAILLEDKRCTDRSCDTGRLISSFSSMFPGMKLKKLEWAQEEAKKLYADEEIKYLPVIFFGPEVEKADGFARLQRFLKPSKSGAWKVFSGRAQHDPSAEICDNKVDDTGNGKVDCDDETCGNTLVCREEVAGKLELFVMSECPFGLKALNAMEEVLAAFGDDLKFEVHFIGDEQGGKPTSMHGQGEVDEDIRELCAFQKFPKTYMNYILCRNKNIRDANWQACTGGDTGVDAKVIEDCFNGEGSKLLVEDMAIAKGLGLSASPSWVANGRHKFSGVDAATIGRNICQHNPGFEGCKKQLTATPQGGGGGGSCN